MTTSPSEPNSEEDMVKTFHKAFQEAYRRYLQGVRVVANSYDTPVGLTPKTLVWSLNKTKLYHYRPTIPPAEQQVKHIPLLLVYALINKPYIFDLHPGASFVEFMLKRGFDIYLLDWGTPGPEDKNTRFDDYATEYLPRAVRKMLRLAGAGDFSLLGYCLGGTLSVLYAALYPDAPLRNLMLLAAPLDFSKRDSIFAGWFDERFFNIDRFVDSLGNIPPELVEAGSKMLKPVENYAGTYAMLWERLDDSETVEHWQAVHRWVHDGVPFAGEAFRQWVKDYIRANELIKSEHTVKGQRVDLANIRAPLLNVVAEYDHIVPPSHSTTIMDAVSSRDKWLEIIPAGHIGLMSSRRAEHKLWPKIADWLAERSHC